MSIFERVNRANDRAGQLSYELGDPLRRQVVLRHRTSNSGSASPYAFSVDDTLLTPPPKVTTVSPRLVGLDIGDGNNLNTAITVSASDLFATVSRSYSRSLFTGKGNERVSVWVDPALNSSGNLVYESGPEKRIVGGSEYRIVFLDDRDCCAWKLILRKLSDG